MNMSPYMVKGTLQMCLRIMRWGDYPGLSSWIQYNHRRLYKGERETGERDLMLALEMEEEATSQGVQQPLEAGKDRETDGPLDSLSKDAALPTHCGFLTSRTVK